MLDDIEEIVRYYFTLRWVLAATLPALVIAALWMRLRGLDEGEAERRASDFYEFFAAFAAIRVVILWLLAHQ